MIAARSKVLAEVLAAAAAMLFMSARLAAAPVIELKLGHVRAQRGVAPYSMLREGGRRTAALGG